MRNLHLILLVTFLCIIGLGLAAYKTIALHFPLVPNTKSNIWNIEARISFQANGKPAKVSVFIPKSTTRIAVLDESFISHGFGLTTSMEDGNRSAEWSIRRATGRQTVYYHAVVRLLDHSTTILGTKLPEIVNPGFEGASLEAARMLLKEAHSKSSDRVSLVRILFSLLATEAGQDNVELLLGHKSNELTQLDTLVRILALDHIPARIVHGVRLENNQRKAALVRWLEVHDDKNWLTIDPLARENLDLSTLLPWWRGMDSMGLTSGGSKLEVDVAINQNEEEAIVTALEGGRISKPVLLEFSLFGLPLQTQNVFRVMLLVPLGGLLVVILRNIVGLPTFGTFMPVLVALAFRETDIVTGAIFFSLVVALGLLVRFYLEKLNLLLVPRLAAVLCVVVLLLLLLAIISHKFGIEHGLSIALFPMVILTMTIERMSIAWEEMGPGEALTHGLGSLFAAILATLLMSIESLEHLLFVFPELLLVILAICILLGRYTGYRLSELYRFRAFLKEKN